MELFLELRFQAINRNMSCNIGLSQSPALWRLHCVGWVGQGEHYKNFCGEIVQVREGCGLGEHMAMGAEKVFGND